MVLSHEYPLPVALAHLAAAFSQILKFALQRRLVPQPLPPRRPEGYMFLVFTRKDCSFHRCQCAWPEGLVSSPLTCRYTVVADWPLGTLLGYLVCPKAGLNFAVPQAIFLSCSASFKPVFSFRGLWLSLPLGPWDGIVPVDALNMHQCTVPGRVRNVQWGAPFGPFGARKSPMAPALGPFPPDSFFHSFKARAFQGGYFLVPPVELCFPDFSFSYPLPLFGS